MAAAENDEIICTIDAANILRSVSPSCRRILGWTTQDMVGKCPECFFLAEDLIALPVAPQTPDLSGRRITFNARVRRNDGSYALMAVLAGAMRGKGADATIKIVLIMRVISDSKTLRTGVFRPGTFDDAA